MVPLLPLRDGVRALPISSFRQSMPSFYMNAPDCICSPGRLPLGAFCTGRDDLEREALHDDRISIRAPRAGCDFDGLKKLLNGTSFQSTRPVWGATRLRQVRGKARQFQSTRPMWGATTRTLWKRTVFWHFNPRAPCGARQQKYTKLLYTLLRQKAILRQFHAKRRLLKRFSTYKYRNTFLICSANRMGKICTLPLRTTRSLDLPKGMSACSQSARFCFRTFFPSSKTADYPASDP